MATKKQVNDVLRSKKGGPHEDKREKTEREFNNERVRQFIEELRKRHAKTQD